MQPVKFEQCNVSQEANDPQLAFPFYACSATMPDPHKDGDVIPIYITCWRANEAEIEEMTRTGLVWVSQVGERAEPLAVFGISPFK